MKILQIPQIPHLFLQGPIQLLTQELDALPRHPVAEMPWPDALAKPDVTFSMAYNRDCLFLKYYVQERSVRARHRRTNSPVYKDSCVEFFIAFQGESSYYNLEFNCLGTCRAGFGPGREDRTLLPESTLAKIKTWSSLKVDPRQSPRVRWELTVAIPSEVFTAHRLPSFEGVPAKVNFYKCGDELPEPHYLTWNTVKAPQPNFHLPQFFGKLLFA
ncbi:carbohydrate-binding family 9-like protein [Rufibacter glacialis]|uniref:Carbohydrate-binding family 9-like protein n=1 Tax=Rufibacter glacialis TaxID=1259555 RepID=A0A5M8Q924_9BACT|nr:carbohydrate-binding family 9-like protein [Rufibacter glacialis]KAA6432437.1 hypothetical protein FOE74_15160 [Rufibacter glacialis]GGK78663.1 hypothetical protein GCM10011405_28160 [Rufibacter glacialis]